MTQAKTSSGMNRECFQVDLAQQDIMGFIQ